MGNEKKIVIYATSTCPYCKKAKAFLDENKLVYEYYDVGLDAEKRKEMFDNKILQETVLALFKKSPKETNFPLRQMFYCNYDIEVTATL